MIEKVDSEAGFINRHIPQRRVEVGELKIPKFKISFGVEVLIGFGIPIRGIVRNGGITDE